MDDQRTEACGRCSMTSVVSMAAEENESSGHDPFDGPRIEIPEDEMRRVAKPQIWLGRVKRRLDEVATRLTYGH